MSLAEEQLTEESSLLILEYIACIITIIAEKNGEIVRQVVKI